MSVDRRNLEVARRAKIGGEPLRSRRGFRPWSDLLETRALMALFPGNPLAVVTPQPFTGVGTGQAQGAMTAFRSAIGGVDNGNTASPQVGGFRSINWDAVNIAGSDFGGGSNTTVIAPGQTVGIPSNRFQTRGVFFDEINAVSGNGFVGANPNVTEASFPFFSPGNTFAPINNQTVEVSFVLPSTSTNTPTPAATRGFGAIFIGSQGIGDDASRIDYFSGDRFLGSADVPASGPGVPAFVGALFPDSLVTRVVLTVGTGTLLGFDGTNIVPTSGPVTDLAVLDDFDYAEPVPLGSLPPVLPGPQGTSGATPTIAATVGGVFTGTVATFSDTEAATTGQAYTALINWGDGRISNGTVVRNAQGGFDVTGSNTFARSGRFPVSVRVQKFDPTGTTAIDLTNTAEVASTATTTTLVAAPTSVIAGQALTFTATVAVPEGSTATGNVTFLDGTTPIGVVPVGADGTAVFSTSSLSRGSHSITAVYNGDESFGSSTSTATTVDVRRDVTNQIRVTLNRARFRRGRFRQIVEMTNTGDALPGPLFLVLDNLRTGTVLVNGSGTTRDELPAGRPFILISNTGLGQGGTVQVELVFRARNARAIRFNPQILAGSASI